MIALLFGLLSTAVAQDAPAEDPPEDPEKKPKPTPVPADPEPFQLDFVPQDAPAPVQPAQPVPAQPYPVPAQPYPVPAQPYPVPAQPYPAPAQPYPAPAQPQPAPAQPTPAPVQPAPAPSTYSYDSVFLAPLQPYKPELQGKAVELTASLNATLSKQHALITVDQVPGWPDYSANVYMLSCPEGQYSGCALVCGNRVNAEWTVGGTVTPGLYGGVNVELVFIENTASREVLSFGVALEGEDDAALIEGVNTIFAKILSGAFEQVDLRAVDTDPAERAKLDKAQREILAASLAEYESQAGAVDRSQIDRGQLTQPKLSKADIAQMRVREELKPWEVLEMSEGEYRRYNNSGKNINEWRRLRRGRFGQLVGRLGLGGGNGPYGQSMDSRYTLDDQLQLAELEQYQYVGQAPHFFVDFEAGFGVLPFLDITGHVAYHRGPFEYFINQERVGQPVVVNPNDFKRRSTGSWEFGARASFVPMVVSPVRPALHGGVSFWKGTTWDSFLQGLGELQPMKPMSTLLLHVGPGVELSPGPVVNVFIRGFADIPIGGQRSELVKAGSGFIQERADPDTFKVSAPGFSVEGGLVFRIPVIGSTDGKNRTTIEFEDEGDL